MKFVRKFWKQLVLAALALLFVCGAAYLFSSRQKSSPLPSVTVARPATSTRSTQPASQPISHIFIIVEENETAQAILGNSAAPYLNQLAKEGAVALNYSAVAHPSLPNYLALTSGSTDGISTDCNPPGAGCIVNVANVADLIEKSGRSWKEYAESMPSACYTLNDGQYATKHNPFIYYQDIVNNAARCNDHVVPYAQLSSDLKSSATTPNFGFITPNLCNDMHNCGIAQGDAWLASNVGQILNSAAFRSTKSLLIITWDEGNLSNNHVLTIFAGTIA